MSLLEAKSPEAYWTPDTIAWWQKPSQTFKSPQEARAWMFRYLEHSDRQPHAHLFGGVNGPNANQIITDHMPLYRDRRGFHIGNKPKISRARMPMIGTEQPEGSAPDVAWYDQDLQDSGRHVSPASIARDYVREADRQRVTVYPAYVPRGDIPDEICAEEECDDEDGGSYDWDQFRFRGSPPPIKLLVKRDGTIEIVDGNHRLRWWREQGYDDIPAWVIDYRPVKPRPTDEE